MCRLLLSSLSLLFLIFGCNLQVDEDVTGAMGGRIGADLANTRAVLGGGEGHYCRPLMSDGHYKISDCRRNLVCVPDETSSKRGKCRLPCYGSEEDVTLKDSSVNCPVGRTCQMLSDMSMQAVGAYCLKQQPEEFGSCRSAFDENACANDMLCLASGVKKNQLGELEAAGYECRGTCLIGEPLEETACPGKGHICSKMPRTLGESFGICAMGAEMITLAEMQNRPFSEELVCNDITKKRVCLQDSSEEGLVPVKCIAFSEHANEGMCMAFCGGQSASGPISLNCPFGARCTKTIAKALSIMDTLKKPQDPAQNLACKMADCTQGKPCPEACLGNGDAYCQHASDLPEGYGVCKAYMSICEPS